MQISSISPASPAPMPEPVAPQVPVAQPVAPAAPEPTDPVIPAESPSKFLQKLASGHFNPVADLRHRMRLSDEIAAADLELPELAAPHGNGKAYAKFLAAYRAMTPATPSPIAPSQPLPGQPAASEQAVAADRLDCEG